MTDQELLQGIIDRDKTAVQYLVRRFHKQVIKTAYYFVHDMKDAEDLAQDVCIEILESARNFRGNASLNTWIYRITVNKSLNFIRAEFRATVQQLESARLTEPPAFAEARLLQRLEEYVALPQAALWPQPMRLSRMIYLSLGAAAAILLGVMLGFTGEKKLLLRKASDPMMDMRTELNVPAIAEEDVIQFSHQ
jgi:RNA polymerase sigma factor (sigma-70 family)